MRDAFAVLFFVSVGMLFWPMVQIDEPLKVLAVVLVIMVGKTLATFALRYPLNKALTVGVRLAQIDEFSSINEREAERLARDIVGTVFVAKHELARGLSEHVLTRRTPDIP